MTKTVNTKCKICKHSLKMHKDIANSQGVRDGKHLSCLAPAIRQNDFFTRAFGGTLACSCNGKEILSLTMGVSCPK